MALTVIAAIAVLRLFQQRRTPQSVLAWLIFFATWPWVALPLFLLLGVRKERIPVQLVIRPGEERLAHPPPLAQNLCALGAPPAMSGNKVHVIADSDEAAAAIDRLIDGARETLDVATYLIQPDDIGAAFVERLAARARDGLRVRLLIDRLGGGRRRPKAALREFAAAGGELQFFPRLFQGPPISQMNLRNHRKMMIADGSRVLTGGRNIGRDYLGASGDPEVWRDLTLELEGPVAHLHPQVFASNWEGEVRQGERPFTDGAGISQLVVAGPDTGTDILHDGLVHAIHAARERIWIVTPYFVPTEALAGALSIAARRGLDVRIILPQRSNHMVADIARGSFLRNLSEDGCRVICLPETMIHAKAGLIDDAAWVGSANFDARSMLLNFETVVFLYDRASVARVSDWAADLAAEGRSGMQEGGRVRKAAEKVLSLWAPIL